MRRKNNELDRPGLIADPQLNFRAPYASRTIAITVTLVASGAGDAADVSWIGADGGSWELPANWSTGALPGAADNALLGNFNTVFDSGAVDVQSYSGTGRMTVNGGTLQSSAASSLGLLSQSSGSLGGSGNLTVTGPADITYGDHRGSGTTILQGASTISGSGFRLDGGRTLRNENTLTWTGGQIIYNNTFSGQSGGAGSGTINNAATGTFVAQGDSAFNIFASDFGGTDTGADAVFNNAGTFRKAGSGAGSTTTVDVAFNNTGTVQVQTGVLSLNNVGTQSGATFSISDGATLRFGGGTHDFKASTTELSGRMELTTGVLNVVDPHTITGVGSFNQSSGTVQGADLTIASNADITYGDHRGSGTTILQGASTISGSGFRLDGGRTLRNENTLTWTGGQIIYNNTISGQSGGAGSGTINNAATGTFIAQGDSAFNIFASDFGGTDTGADAVFNNAGTFRKAGSGASNTTTVDVAFNNTGTVQVQTGVLSLNNGGTHTGNFDVAAGAVLGFGGGTHNLNGGTITSPGTVRVSGNTNVNVNTGYGIAGNTDIDIQGGFLNLLGGNATTGSLEQSNGSVSGANNLTVTGPADITYGDHRGSGTTILQGASTISSSGFRLDGGRTLRNENTLTWTGGQIIYNNTFSGQSGGAGSGTINNAATGTFIAQGDSVFNISASNFGGTETGADAVFNNAGTFRKAGSGADSTTTIDVAFNNTGTVQVQTGILSLNNGGTQSGAILSINDGATLRFGGGTHDFKASTTELSGRMALTAGVLNVVDPHTITGVGSFNQSSGTVQGADLTIASNADITYGDHRGSGTTILQGASTISGSGFLLDGGRTLRNENTLTWTGGQILYNNNVNGTGIAGSGTINNAATGTFIAQGDSVFNISASNFGGTDTGADAVFNNAGTFRKAGSGADSTTTIDVAFNNTGTVQVQTGVLSLNNGGTQSGAILSINDGATLRFGGGTHDFKASTTELSGRMALTAGVLNVVDPHTITGVGSFNQSSGTVQGADLTIASNADITYGDHRGSGTTILQGASTISGSGFLLDGGRTLRNENTLTWTGGQILYNNNVNGTGIAGSGTINNAATGTFIAQGDSVFNISASNFGGTDTGADAVFNNAGNFRKAGSSADSTTTVDVAFNNTGTVQVQTGVLNLTNDGTHTGNFDVAAGAVLGFGGGTHNLNGGTITSPGTMRVSGNTNVNVNTGYGIAGTTDIQNGFLNLLGGNATTGSLKQSNGSVSGSNNLTVTGPADITYGDHRGSGTTILQGASTISGSGFLLDGGRTLRNENTLTWTGGQILYNNNVNGTGIAGSGTINNAATGTFIAQGDSVFNISASNFGGTDTGADAAFNNAGTFRKAGSGAGSTTTVDVAFNNTGTVQVDTGRLVLSSTFTNQGLIDVNAGATLQGQGATFVNQGTLQGNGTYQTRDPSTELVNSGTLAPGVGDIGTLTISGDYQQTDTGLFIVQLASTSSFDRLNVRGDINLSGTLRVESFGGYNPLDGDSFTIATFDDGINDPSDLTGLLNRIIWSGFDARVSFTASYFANSLVLNASVSEVPLPAGFWLLGSALAALAAGSHRRRV